jgi:hypothetical protein
MTTTEKSDPKGAVMEKVLGKFRGEVVTFDGVTVRSGNFDTNLDCDLGGSFRNWLARRGVVLP